MRTIPAVALTAVLAAGATWLAVGAQARSCCVVCVPCVITEYAKATRTGGEFAMEIDACGRLFRLEAELEAAQLPPAVAAAAEKAVPGGTVTSVHKDWIQGQTYYEVVKEVDGRRREILMRADGSVVGHEDVLAADAVPAGVLAAAEKAAPGGEVMAVEAISGPEALGGNEHHVKTMVGGEVLRVSVLPNGQVGRVLRKIKAEVKVPRR